MQMAGILCLKDGADFRSWTGAANQGSTPGLQLVQLGRLAAWGPSLSPVPLSQPYGPLHSPSGVLRKPQPHSSGPRAKLVGAQTVHRWLRRPSIWNAVRRVSRRS